MNTGEAGYQYLITYKEFIKFPAFLIKIFKKAGNFAGDLFLVHCLQNVFVLVQIR